MHPHFQTAAQVGETLGLTQRAVKSLARRRAIPCHRLSYRTLRFEIEKVKAALARLEITEIGRPK